MMPKKSSIHFLMAMGFVVLALLLAACSSSGGIQRPYLAPPSNFETELLAGSWRAEYGQGASDTIRIEDNGNFTQSYENGEYKFEIHGKWSVEQVNEQQTILRLQGARYFLAGQEFARLEGKEYPCPESFPNCRNGKQESNFGFYDPIGRNLIEMRDELILNVRVKSNGELTLLHMWTSADRGYSFIGGSKEEFIR